MEREDIRIWRSGFIRMIRKYRQEGRPIVYIDESYIYKSHTSKKQWSNKSKHGLRAPVSKGNKLIMIHAGKDCNDNVDYNNYLKWVKEKLIPNLKPKSVIAMDNASYHNKDAIKASRCTVYFSLMTC